MAPAVRLNAIKTWFGVVKDLEALAPPTTDVPMVAYISDLAGERNATKPG
jgi:hypothetical protein